MDNKFGMEQQETEEDITKEKVFTSPFLSYLNISDVKILAVDILIIFSCT